MQVISKDQFKELGKPRTELLPLPEIGEGFAIKVKGYTLGQRLEISKGSKFLTSDGSERYDERNDRLLSVIGAVAEPSLSMADGEWILNLDDGVVQKIIAKALDLSYRSESAYDDLKESMRRNPLLRRIYVVCVEKLGRLPLELADVPEEEFMTALAALEVEEEQAQVTPLPQSDSVDANPLEDLSI